MQMSQKMHIVKSVAIASHIRVAIICTQKRM